MELINAFKHPESGRVFETIEDYNEHLKTFNKRKAEKEAKEKLITNFNTNVHYPRKNSKTLSEFLDNVVKLLNLYNGNFVKKITASGSLHYRTHARCKPLNKESESPFFLAKLDIEYYTSGYTPASWEVIFLKVKSPITSDVVEIPGFNVNTNKEAVIFISDIPYLQSSLMDYFKKKEDIKLKQEEYKKNRENHIALKETFGSSQESAKEIFSIIEDLRIKQLKIQESLKIQEIVYKTHLDELQKQYEKDNPFDYTVIGKLQSELLDIDTEVNKILNKK